jgi:hypothetical protein
LIWFGQLPVILLLLCGKMLSEGSQSQTATACPLSDSYITTPQCLIIIAFDYAFAIEALA